MVLQRIYRGLRAGLATISPFHKVKGILSWAFGVEALWPRLFGEKAINDGYAKVLAVFALINKDAAKFAMIPRFVYELTNDQERGPRKKYTGNKELLRLLKQPNPYQGQSEFLEAVRVMYKGSGEAIVWLNRGDTQQIQYDQNKQMVVGADGRIVMFELPPEERRKKPILEMWVLPSAYVGIIPDPDNVFGVKGYFFETGDGRIKAIPKEDIIHWKRYNPLYDYTDGSHLRGLSTVDVASCDIAEYKEISKSSMRMHKNDGAKGVLSVKGLNWSDLDEVQKKGIEDTVNNKINSNDVKGAVATMGGDWTYHDIAKKSVDLDTLAAKKLKWQEMCFAFEVPFNFFDQNAKYDNADAWIKGWVYQSIMPAMQRFDEKLTTALTEAFNLVNKVEICGDIYALPEMQKDLGNIATAMNTAWWISPNDKRIAMGYDPYNDPRFDEPWVGFGLQPLSQYTSEQEFQQQSSKLGDDDY